MATITVTPIRTFTSGETVTPTKLNELSQPTVALTAGTIVDADVSASAAIALSKLATGALPTAITTTTANIVDASVTQAKLAANVVGNGPAFYAFASGNTSIPNNSSTKVTLDGERFDTASCFASSRFTPNVAGYYQLNAAVWLGSTGAAYLAAEIRKNGSLSEGLSGSIDNGSDTRSSVAGGLIYLNGTTDYVELFCIQASGSTRTATAAQNATFFSGFLARAA